MMEIDYQGRKDWPSSTFHRFVEKGLYPANWGEGVSFQSTDKFGE
jgi:hypothetical protein